MKKKLAFITLVLCALITNAQTPLTLDQCRQLALDNNKRMAVASKQIQAAHYTMQSYKGNFFPNITASGTGLYNSANGTFSLPGGNLPTFLPDAKGHPFLNGGFAYFPGIDLNYKVRTVWMGSVQVEQPIFMGGKILATGVGIGIAIGTAVGYFRSKNKKADKPKKLNWFEKKFVKSLEKKGVQVTVPIDVVESDQETVEDSE